MKKILYLFGIGLILVFAGCSDDSGGGTGTDPFGTGGGGGTNTGNVAVTISIGQDDQGNLYFGFKPNPSSVVTSVTAVCNALGVNETVPVTGGEIYSANNPLYIGPVQNLQNGQQWVFTVKGNIGSTNGTAFTTTVNYTVQ
jgi:hypothetical protein